MDNPGVRVRCDGGTQEEQVNWTGGWREPPLKQGEVFQEKEEQREPGSEVPGWQWSCHAKDRAASIVGLGKAFQ
jgi:hypothetical protein